MSSYVYKETEHWRDEKYILHQLFTVGFYDPDGKWHSESDHDSKEDAAARVHYLNGGFAERKISRAEYVELLADTKVGG